MNILTKKGLFLAFLGTLFFGSAATAEAGHGYGKNYHYKPLYRVKYHYAPSYYSYRGCYPRYRSYNDYYYPRYRRGRYHYYSHHRRGGRSW